jgi:DNA-binding MarR family transcriptional regulator
MKVGPKAVDSISVFSALCSAYSQSALGNAFPRTDSTQVIAVMVEVQSHGPVTQKRIHEATGLSMPALSKLIGPCVNRKWLVRTPKNSQDGTKVVTLTEAGQEMLSDLGAEFDQLLCLPNRPTKPKTKKSQLQKRADMSGRLFPDLE